MKQSKSMVFLISLALLLLFLATITSCSARDKKKFSETQWALQVEQTLAKDLYSPNYKDKKFFAPWMKMEDKGFLDVLKWKLSSKANYTKQEKTFLPRVIPDTAKTCVRQW